MKTINCTNCRNAFIILDESLINDACPYCCNKTLVITDYDNTISAELYEDAQLKELHA